MGLKSFYKNFAAIALIMTISACTSRQPGVPVAVDGESYGSNDGIAYKIGSPYQVEEKWYYPKEDYSYSETGMASWYGPQFHNKKTANGETYDMNSLTAAHRTLPLPSMVRVTNLQNGRSIVLKVNDRGPFAKDRIIDVSRRAAQLLGFINQGTTKVRVELLAQESKSLKETILSSEGRENLGAMAGAETYTDSEEKIRPVNFVSPEKPKLANLPPAIPNQQSAWSSPEQKTDVRADPNYLTQEIAGTYIQLGAFSSYDNAAKLCEKLTSVGKTVISPVDIDGKTLYRVRIGPIASEYEAQSFMTNLKSLGYNNSVVVKN